MYFHRTQTPETMFSESTEALSIPPKVTAGSRTTTVIVEDPVTLLPAASETEKVITVSPTTNSEGASLVILDVRSPSLLSVATALLQPKQQ